MTRLASTLLAAVLLTALGCNSGPTVHPVKGQVINKGKGPATDLAGYSVQFQSTTDPAEMPGGPIDADGTFLIYTRVGGEVIPGAKEGSYLACFLPPAVEGGAPPPLVIPKRYTSLETSKLQYSVKPGENELTIEIERD